LTAPAEAPYSKTIKVCADAVAAAMHAAIKPAPTVYTFLFMFIVFCPLLCGARFSVQRRTSVR
jgi:hypothetical protein